MSVNTLVFENVEEKRYVSVNMPDHAIMTKDRFCSLAFNERVLLWDSLVKFTLDDGTWVYRVGKVTDKFVHLNLVKEPG